MAAEHLAELCAGHAPSLAARAVLAMCNGLGAAAAWLLASLLLHVRGKHGARKAGIELL